MRQSMGHACLNRGAEMAQKGLTAYKHYCAVVSNKHIVSERLNEYAGADGTHHAEESALLRRCMSRRSRGLHEKNCCLQDRQQSSTTSSRSLQRNGSLCLSIRVQGRWLLGDSQFQAMRSLCAYY